MKVKSLVVTLTVIWLLAIVAFTVEISGLERTADILRTSIPLVIGLIFIVKLSYSIKNFGSKWKNVSAIFPMIIGIYVYLSFYPIFESSFASYRDFVRSFAWFPLRIDPDSIIFYVINHNLYTKGASILGYVIIGVGFPIPALILGALSAMAGFVGLMYLKRAWTRFRERKH